MLIIPNKIKQTVTAPIAASTRIRILFISVLRSVVRFFVYQRSREHLGRERIGRGLQAKAEGGVRIKNRRQIGN